MQFLISNFQICYSSMVVLYIQWYLSNLTWTGIYILCWSRQDVGLHSEKHRENDKWEHENQRLITPKKKKTKNKNKNLITQVSDKTGFTIHILTCLIRQRCVTSDVFVCPTRALHLSRWHDHFRVEYEKHQVLFFVPV